MSEVIEAQLRVKIHPWAKAKKKTATFTLIFVCLIASGTLCLQPVKAQTPSAITINADGTVTPLTAPIQQIGNIYALTSDFAGSITVNRSNMIIEGKNHSLSGGLLIQGLSNVTVEEFVITNGALFGDNGVNGILLDNASQVTVTNNTLSGIWNIWEMNGEGFFAIDILGGGLNVVSGNSLLNNGQGLVFRETQKNLIVGNNFVSSMLIFSYSSNNTVYHNNFIGNYGQLATDGDYENPNSINVWDNGYPSGGNYWANYVNSGAKEIDLSGIGNRPYIIDTKNSDRYPLMEPFNITFFELQVTPPRIAIDSPTNQTYKKPSVPLFFTVHVYSSDKTVNWTGYSLDEKQNVTLTGDSAVLELTDGLHILTVYANDTYGNMGFSTISFTVEKPQLFSTFAIATVSLVAATIIVAVLLVYLRRRKQLNGVPTRVNIGDPVMAVITGVESAFLKKNEKHLGPLRFNR